MKSKKILVLLPLEEAGKRRLEQILAAGGAGWTAAYSSVETVTAGDLEGVEAVLGNLPTKLIPAASSLRWMQLSMAGADAYVLEGVLPEKVTLTNTTGAFGLAISEHMVACVLALYKKLHLYRDNQLRGRWLDRGEVRQIEGAVVLSVGMGDIGGSFAKKMKALGAYVIGIRRLQRAKPDWADEVYQMDSLDRVLPRADIVALSLPGTPETFRLFDRERIFRMKDGATLLNVGRGNVLDTDALCDALSCGKLYAASLDVTDPEPLPSDHRLWKLENALITPHVSGFFHLRATYDNIVDITLSNLERFLGGVPLACQVDRKTGYRRL